MFLKDLYIKWKLRHLREDGAMWIRKHYGERYATDFLDKYDKINSGIPIGNLKDTVVFLNLVEEIKQKILNNELK